MKNFVTSVCIGIMLLACQKKDGYQIIGHLDGGGNGQAVLSILENNQDTALDTVTMKNGEFMFSGVLTDPTFVLIHVFPENEKSVVLSFIAENSPIQVEGKWSNVEDHQDYRSLGDLKITGSRNHDVYEQFTDVPQQLMKHPEYKEYADATKKIEEIDDTNPEEYERLLEKADALSGEFNQAVKKKRVELVLTNKSVASVALCLEELSGEMSLDELKPVFLSLDTNVQQCRFAKVVREDLAARERMQPGMPAPDFDLATPDGSHLALSDLRGKYVVLDFWSSWCGPCRASFPEMKKIYDRFKDKGLEILGIADDRRKEDWLKALEQDQLPWKQVIDKSLQDKSSRISALYAIHFWPSMVLIDPQGMIVGKAEDKLQLVEWLEERLPIE